MTNLQEEIRRLIVEADITNSLTYLDTVDMSEDLNRFVRFAIEKFVAGQREHGGKLIDRNLILELEKEQIDSFWYTQYLKRKLTQRTPKAPGAPQ